MWIGIQSLDITEPHFTMVVPGLALLHIDLWARFRGTFKECTDLYIQGNKILCVAGPNILLNLN